MQCLKKTNTSKLPSTYFWKIFERCPFVFPSSFADLLFVFAIKQVISHYNRTRKFFVDDKTRKLFINDKTHKIFINDKWLMVIEMFYGWRWEGLACVTWKARWWGIVTRNMCQIELNGGYLISCLDYLTSKISVHYYISYIWTISCRHNVRIPIGEIFHFDQLARNLYESVNTKLTKEWVKST